MITKLTALAMSCIITVGLVAAAAPTVELDEREMIAFAMAQDCRNSYRDYQNGNDRLDATIKKWPEALREQVFAACVGYTFGYYDGERISHA